MGKRYLSLTAPVFTQAREKYINDLLRTLEGCHPTSSGVILSQVNEELTKFERGYFAALYVQRLRGGRAS